MRSATLKLFVKGQVLWNTLKDENGQDLVEYAAVICVVMLGLVTGMNTVANSINAGMALVANRVTSILSST